MRESGNSARWRRRLAVVLVSALAWILVLETGYRLWLRVHGEPYSAWRTRERIAQRIDLMSYGITQPAEARDDARRPPKSIHPFVGFLPSRSFAWFSSEAEYYRSAEAAQNYDILILGASVANEFCNWSNIVFAPLLDGRPELGGRKVRLHVGACPAYKEPQQVTFLALCLAYGHAPDCVLCLDGFNELAVAADNGAHGVDPVFPAWFEMQTSMAGIAGDQLGLDTALAIEQQRRAACDLRDFALESGLTYSAVAGRIVETRIDQHSAAAQRALAAYRAELARRERPLAITGSACDPDPLMRRRACVEAWKQSSLSLAGMCAAHSIQFLHVLQPALDDTGSKPLTPAEVEHGRGPPEWVEAVREGYPLLRAAGEELRARGVDFVDASRVFAATREEVFRDGCHFEEFGCTLLARLLAPRVLAGVKR